MASKTIVFTERHEELVDGLVRSGQYHDASEVVRDALRLIEHREAENAARLHALRDAARQGIEALERGDFREFESFADLERHLTAASEAVIGGKPKR